MHQLYPLTDIISDGFLDVGDGHRIYWRRYGNPDGIPVVCVHGGPGSGMNLYHAQLFDPARFHIIMYDQRGSGKSTPHGELSHNTTAHLVDDMEALRNALGIDRWYVFGGSWGATLALAYIAQHAAKTLGTLIYGTFLCRESELNSLFHRDGVAAQIYPEQFDAFIAQLPPDQQNTPITAYRDLFCHADPDIAQNALMAWTRWEKQVACLTPNATNAQQEWAALSANFDYIKAHSLIEQHYFAKNGFIDGDQLIQDVAAALSGEHKALPFAIIQGRYDLICPTRTAYDLHNAIPHSQLLITDAAGHTIKEPITTTTTIDYINTCWA